MNIGRAAALTGASAKAIRLYETMGLLGEVKRAGKYRIYSDSDINIIKLIREARTLGFKLSDLLAFIAENERPSWHKILAMIDARDRKIDEEIEVLKDMQRKVKRLKQEIMDCPDIALGATASVLDCESATR